MLFLIRVLSEILFKFFASHAKDRSYCLTDAMVRLASIAFIMLLMHSTLFAQSDQPSDNVNNLVLNAHDSNENTDEGPTPPWIIGLGGGYFYPRSDAAEMFTPTWSARFFVRQPNMSGTLFGLGFDGTYAMSSDQKYDGKAMYAILHPHVVATFSIFADIQFQFKAAPGVSLIYTSLNNKNSSALSLTLGGGAGMFYVFGEHFVLGLEAEYYYFFMIHSSAAANAGIYAGYRL